MALKIRVDDFPGTKPEEFHKHNLENYRLFENVLADHGRSCVLGLIDRHVSDAAYGYFVKSPPYPAISRPAVHGFRHSEDRQLEFKTDGTEEEDFVFQILRLLKNMYCTTMYIPPHNAIDRKTVNALVRAGYTDLFGGPGSDLSALVYAKDAGLDVHVSGAPLEYGRSDELLARGSVRHLEKRIKDNGEDVWLTLHWTWENNIGLHHLDRYLTELGKVHV